MVIQKIENGAAGLTDVKNKSDIRILVVDDREDNLFSIETILEKDNYTIVKANSGKQALKILLKEHDFSLILMDVQMPDMNGLETATLIYERDIFKSIPIIFITAHSNDEEYLFKGYRMGGVDYIYKPINPELLRAKVGVFVELYRKNQQLLNHERKLLAANNSLQKEIEERRLSEEKVRLLNEQLVQNNEHLKAVNEELDRFAYVASHDLQEPLRKIMVFSDRILSKKDAPEVTEKYLQKISNSSERMQSLINNLLQYSRHSVNASDFEKTDLNEIIKDIISDADHQIDKAEATVTYSGLPVVMAVPALIRQVFSNLINNALKFRREGVKPEINITSELRNERSAKMHLITIADNGIGFSAEYADDIFKPFKRLHSVQEYEGTGIGLSICRKIVEKHGGKITAQSTPGKGSSFFIELPA